MGSYIIRRSGLALVVMWGVVTVIFVVVRLLPGDPVSAMVGPGATAEQIEVLREEHGLDDPLLVQYGIYLSNVVQGDFGYSFRTGQTAAEAVAGRIGGTVRLGLAAMGFTLVVVFPLGIAAALKARTLPDRIISTASLVGQSLPDFWIGIMLALVFARNLGWLPSVGDTTPLHYILPAFTLSLPFLSVLIRLVRSGLLEVMNEGYIQTARSKGFRERVVIGVHGVRNMLIPVVTMAGLHFGSVLSGTVVIETIFAWPGIGSLLVDAIHSRDFAVVQATVAIIAGVFVFVNLLVDVLYAYLDPRVKVASE